MIDKITESEFEIMKALWDYENPLTFSDIRKYVQRNNGWSPSTIKTLLYRLCEKGAVSQKKEDVYYYRPLISQEEYSDHTTQSLIDKLYNGKAANLIATLVKNDTLAKADIDELRKLLHGED
ncbi:MAG TPA: BlaI/MecI/CopY family transcriptional regulator [Clostridia bacterium]|nr:BlaI/MecI/CopY family transcriptional regulator [Clostridia bacterium]